MTLSQFRGRLVSEEGIGYLISALLMRTKAASCLRILSHPDPSDFRGRGMATLQNLPDPPNQKEKPGRNILKLLYN